MEGVIESLSCCLGRRTFQFQTRSKCRSCTVPPCIYDMVLKLCASTASSKLQTKGFWFCSKHQNPKELHIYIYIYRIVVICYLIHAGVCTGARNARACDPRFSPRRVAGGRPNFGGKGLLTAEHVHFDGVGADRLGVLTLQFTSVHTSDDSLRN